MELALLVAWLVIHAVYRGGVGTYCAVKKIDPPWVKNKTERLVNREIRQGRRYEALRSKRTLRGFFGRLWGDLWEDANLAQDQRRQERLAWRLNGSPRLSWRDRAGQWRNAAQPGMRTRLLGLWAQEWWQRGRQQWDRWMSASRARRQDADTEGTREPQAESVVVPEVPDLNPVAAADQQPPAPQADLATPAPPETRPEPTAPDPAPTGRPQLRAVPNPPDRPAQPPAEPETQGARDMTAPTSTQGAPAEITGVQSLKNFAGKVKDHGQREWPAMLENANTQIRTCGLSNDPAIVQAMGRMDEAAKTFAAAAGELEIALKPHEAATEPISNLGARAANTTTAYQNQ